jgi:hypothetical protein
MTVQCLGVFDELQVFSCLYNLQRFHALEADKENELTAFCDRVKSATASLNMMRDAAADSLQDARERNEQLQRLAEWFESSNELEAPAGIAVPPAAAPCTSAHVASDCNQQFASSPSPASGNCSSKPSGSSPVPVFSPHAATSSIGSRLSPMPAISPCHAPALAVSPTVFSPSRNHIRRSLGEGSGAGAVVLCTQVLQTTLSVAGVHL